ncbi:MAG: L-arabinose isomerase [Opitutales bacterium]|nr:L-arabinose isomerase [Opitutales bacterium]
MSPLSLQVSEVWFLTGSQHLYGDDTLRQVQAHADEIVRGLNASGELPLPIRGRAILTTPDAITRTLREAGTDSSCAGVIVWMHTFSPAKMWISGLNSLRRPLLHFHTQFNRLIPWESIDMDFMNLNQSAHGDREFGFACTRLRLNRKVVVGHWADPAILPPMRNWMRAARAWHDWQGMRVARLGDNMRAVAVTEGDKVAAENRFGFSVDGYGVGDLACIQKDLTDEAVDALVGEYLDTYAVAPTLQPDGPRHRDLREAARIELALLTFLKERGCAAFTTTFEDLHGLRQLPGLAVQRLMAAGYGFAAEGDWKTAALLRAMKVMAADAPEGVSFMEDYTYHFDESGGQVLGSHMLEICPSISEGQPKLEIHPLGIGGKEDPVRLVFDCPAGAALNASLIDLGNRFRLVVNTVEALKPESPLPRLPVARTLWRPLPDLPTAAAAWILAGGAHHTGFTRALRAETLGDFAEMAGIEFLLIDETCRLPDLKDRLRWNDLYHHLAHGLGHT